MKFPITLSICVACVCAAVASAVVVSNKRIAAVHGEGSAYKILVHSLRQHELLKMEYEGSRIDEIETLDSIVNHVSSISPGRYKLVMTYHPDACQSCTQSIMDCFTEWMRQRKAAGNVVVLGCYLTKEQMRVDRNIFGTHLVFDIDTNIADLDRLKTPYFFVTDNELKRIMCLYIGDLNNVKQFSLYLSLMSDRFGI